MENILEPNLTLNSSKPTSPDRMRLRFPLQTVASEHRGLLLPLDSSEKLPLIFICSAFWTSVYFLCQLVLRASTRLRPLTLETRKFGLSLLSANIVSLIHASSVTFLSLILLSGYRGISSVAQEWIWGFDTGSSWTICLFAGYMLYDLVLEIATTRNPAYMLHHSAVFLTYCYCALRPFIHYGALVFILWEASTPFMSIRKIMIAYNLQNTRAFHVVEVLFALFFLVSRILFGWVFSFQFFVMFAFHNDKHRLPVSAGILFVLANAILNGLNLNWFLIIAKKALNSNSHRAKTQ